MSLFVECKPDETLAFALGVTRREIEHALGRASVCAQLSRRSGVTGMVDEDPGTVAQPYMIKLKQESWEHDVRVLVDKERDNRIVVLSPRLEEWLVKTAKSGGLKMTEFGFESDNGIHLHAEINQRLNSLQKLVETLLSTGNTRILRLQSLIRPQ